MFTVDELIETVPGSLMTGIVPMVSPVKMVDAVKSGDVKKKAGWRSADFWRGRRCVSVLVRAWPLSVYSRRELFG